MGFLMPVRAICKELHDSLVNNALLCMQNSRITVWLVSLFDWQMIIIHFKPFGIQFNFDYYTADNEIFRAIECKNPLTNWTLLPNQ